MNNAIKTVEKTIEGDPYKLSIYYDDVSESPREWGNTGTMVLFHRSYTLPNEKNWTVEQAEEFVDSDESKNYIILPVWGYNHGGLAMKAGNRTYPFNDSWDSGQLGIIFAKKGTEDLSDEQITNILVGEVETYGKYANGEVYYYVLEKGQEWKNNADSRTKIIFEHEDSCGGFYDIADIADYVPDAFKEDLV